MVTISTKLAMMRVDKINGLYFGWLSELVSLLAVDIMFFCSISDVPAKEPDVCCSPVTETAEPDRAEATDRLSDSKMDSPEPEPENLRMRPATPPQRPRTASPPPTREPVRTPPTSEAVYRNERARLGLDALENRDETERRLMAERGQRSPRSPGGPPGLHPVSPPGRVRSPDGKDATSPPNVTVIQPSVNHPMFSYLYHSGLYSGNNSLPLPMGHMLFGAGMGGSSGLGLPFPSPTSLAELGHLSPSIAAAAAGIPGMTPSMMLNSQLALAASHGLWQQSYFQQHGAHPPSGPGEGATSAPLPAASSHGLMNGRASHRYSPYPLPLTKTTMSSSTAPLPASRLTSPHSVERLATSSPRHHSRDSSPNSSPPPRGGPSNSAATNELKNIERMVNGLERQQERLAAESMAKLTDK